MAIALSSVRSVQLLSAAAARAEQIGHRLFVPIDLPWPSFLDDTRTAVDAISISYRVNRRVRGALHKETFYSKAQKALDKKGQQVECRHVRKPLVKMSANEVTEIVDDTVRRLVQEKLDRYGGDPKTVFADESNLPYFKTKKDGRFIPIKKARIRQSVRVIAVGKESGARYVAPGSNHHMEIVAVLDDDGNEQRWQGHIVSLYEAHLRVSRNEPVVRRDHGGENAIQVLAGGGGIYRDGTRSGKTTGIPGDRYIWQSSGISFAFRWTSNYRIEKDQRSPSAAEPRVASRRQRTEGQR